MDIIIKNLIDSYVHKIVSMGGIVQIYLFGSHAYGIPHEKSDIDLMVIVEDRFRTFEKSVDINIGLIDKRAVPLDILVNRKSDFEESQGFPSMHKTIKEKGMLLYDSDN
jgi:predicted nucleotidyltransferase